MASQSKNLLLNLIVNAVDKAAPVLTNIKTALDGMQSSARNASQAASNAGKNIEAGLKQAATVADNLKKRLDSVSTTLAGVGASLAGAGAALGVPLIQATKTAADFENEMNKLRAAGEIDINTTEGQKQFEALTNKARELGKEGQYSASEVAQAMTELTKAGFRTEEVLSSIGPALNLAFAEGRSTKETAEDLVKVLAGFGLGADQAARATDVLSKTSLATTTSMAGLVEGLKYVSSLASNVGMSLEETTAYLGIFAQKGIDASMAGTGLRRLLGDLSNPTGDARAALAQLGVQVAKNADGSVNLTQTFERLAKSGLSTANAFKIFGDQGGNVAVVATKNLDAIKALTRENDNAAGSLAKFVATIREGLLPSWNQFKKTLGDVGIQLAGPFLQALKGALDGVSSFLRGISEFAKEHPAMAKFFGIFAAGAAALITAAGTAALAIAGLAFTFGNLARAVTATNIASIGPALLASIPSWTAITAAVTSFGTTLSGLGAGIAAFAAGPAVLIAGSIVAILATVAGAYKILSDRAEAAEIQAETLKRSQADLNRAIAEGFDPNKAIQGVSGAALTADPYVDLLSRRRQAVADFVGWNEKLTQAREADAQSWGLGKSAETETAEKSVALARQNLNVITQEINARIDQKSAVEGVGQSLRDNADATKEEIKTSEQLLQLARDRAEIEVKLIQESVKTKEDSFKLELEQAKVRINETIRDESQAQQAISALVADSSQKRIALAEQEYIQLRMAREKGFAEQRAALEAQIAAGEKVADALKGLQDLEKQRTESQIADSRKLTQAVVSELNTQLAAKDEQVKKVKTLEGQLRDEQRASVEALRQVSDANMTEFSKLQAHIGDVNTKLQEAVKLAPSMPEKALELFKQVRTESAGLVQNIEQFNDKLRNAANAGQDALRKVNAYGLQGIDRYKSEISDIELALERANDALKGGRFGEAENLYKSVMSAAQGLPGNAVKTGNAEQDAANLEAAKADARILIQIASGGMNDAIKIQKAQAEETNRQAKANIETAQKAIENLIRAQIDSANQLINALNANTEALQGRLGQTPGQTGQPGQLDTGQGAASGTADLSSAVQSGVQNALGGSGSGSSNLPGYNPTVSGQSGQPDYSSSLMPSERSNPLLDIQLAQTDKLLAQSQSESATMNARMDALKYLESQAGIVDSREQRGYTSGALGSSVFDNLSGIIQGIQGNIQQQAQQTLDKMSSSTSPKAIESTMDKVHESLTKAGETFLQGAGEAVNKLNEALWKVEILVSDNRANLGSVKRV